MKKSFKLLSMILALCITLTYINVPAYAATEGVAQEAATTGAFIPIDGTEAILIDADTGAIIYEQNSLAPVAPASTTKILTTLLVIEAIERGELALDTPVTVTPTAIATINSLASHVNPRLKAGETFNVLELLLAVMVKSDCAACNVLGEKVSGSVNSFVELMNKRGTELGCVNSHWSEPSGYPADDHFTNAYSLALITREALKHDLFRMLILNKSASLPATNKTGVRTFETTNKLLLPGAYYNPYCIGGKTGTCKAAGECMVSIGHKDNKTVIAVVLGTKKKTFPGVGKVEMRFFESNRLLQLGLGY